VFTSDVELRAMLNGSDLDHNVKRRSHGINDGLIRFSIGLETLSDIQDDILQALDAVDIVSAR
jgi:cystathionine beta-lyase/cystathionine gamma-synthase